MLVAALCTKILNTKDNDTCLIDKRGYTMTMLSRKAFLFSKDTVAREEAMGKTENTMCSAISVNWLS